jgi:hypothetical protein
MHPREIEALERWIAEQEHSADSPEVMPLVRQLDELMHEPNGGDPLDRDPLDWDPLVHSAHRIGRRGKTAAARGAARTLVALLAGDSRIVAAMAPEPQPEPAASSRPRRQPSARVLGLIAVAVAGALAGGIQVARALTTPSLTVFGPAPGAVVGSGAIDGLSFTAPGRDLRTERWRLDGRDVTRFVVAQAGKLVFHPHGLAEGRHELEVTAAGGFLDATARRHFDFVVDLTPPALAVMPWARGVSWHPVEIRGTADTDVQVTVSGRRVAMDGGRFSARLQPPVPARVPVVATDPAGNETVAVVSVALTPRRPPVAVRAVHVTADAWASPALRAGVMALVAQHRINTLEIDLKDEAGVVGFAGVPGAARIGASRPVYDLASTVRELHARGVRVIGRLVCFRDPIAAAAAWKRGLRNEVVQTPSGAPYAGYGGFTNFASPAVRRYQIAIAVAAARNGIDDVLYDYVRRPDGPISTMVFPGLHGTPSQAIDAFLRETRIALQPYGTYLGASVFGISVTRPDEVAQDIPAMAREVDYLSPLIYPSHWNDGEYGVSDPNRQPYLIVKRSLADFKTAVAGTGARLVPWLQDFSLGVTYGPAQVRAQIDAARSDGVDEFLLWDASVTYDAAGLRPDAPFRSSWLTARGG